MINANSFFRPPKKTAPVLMPVIITIMFGLLLSALPVSAYVCGDGNGDGDINVGDAVHVISFVFQGGPACVPPESGDANCDGCVNVGDAVALINAVFRSGPEPCSMCPPIEQNILFEMSYSNYAWFPVYRGYYINNDGYVIRYNYAPDVPYSDPWYTQFTEAELMERYSQNPIPVAIVPPDILAQHYAMIPLAAAGDLSPPIATCFDFGTAYYVAYIYNEETEIYQPVLLYQHGDISQKNFAPEAEVLFHWMMSLVGDDPEEIFCPYPE